jgi:hypothetical protein
MPRVRSSDIERVTANLETGEPFIVLQNGRTYPISKAALADYRNGKAYITTGGADDTLTEGGRTTEFGLPRARYEGPEGEGLAGFTDQAEGGQRRQRVESFLAGGPAEGFDTREEALAYLQEQGVHTDEMDPVILRDIVGTLVEMPTPPVGAILQRLREDGFITVTPYQMQLEAAGFAEDPFGPPRVIPTREGGAEVQRPDRTVLNPETGATLYRTGVLVGPDPSTGASSVVFNEADPAQVGSDAWLNQVAANWSAERLQQEKERLVEFGYLSRDALKTEGWNVQVRQAMRAFHENRYLAGGRPIATGETPGGVEKEPLPKFDFTQLQGRARAEVNNIFRELYADQPEERELERFSRAILDMAHELYRQGKGQLSPEQAYGEAAYRVQAQQEQTPQAVFEQEAAEENTELRDSILRAVSVSDRIMRG